MSYVLCIACSLPWSIMIHRARFGIISRCREGREDWVSFMVFPCSSPSLNHYHYWLGVLPGAVSNEVPRPVSFLCEATALLFGPHAGATSGRDRITCSWLLPGFNVKLESLNRGRVNWMGFLIVECWRRSWQIICRSHRDDQFHPYFSTSRMV